MTATPADSRAAGVGGIPARRRAAALGAARDDRVRDAAAVLAPAVLAAALCLVDLTSRSLGFDEAASVTIASQQGHALGAAIAHDGGNMSGYYVLLRLLVALFGTGTFIVRLPSVLSIAAATGLTSLLGLRLFGRRAALVAGVLTAVSLPLVFWGQDARGYAPMVALVAGSFVAFVALVDSDGEGASRAPVDRRALAAYFVCTTVAAYCSFVAVLVIPAQLIALVWRRHAVRRVGYTLAVSVICWIPLMVLAKQRGSGQLFWVPHPSPTVFKQVFQELTSSGMQPSFGTTATTYPLLGITVLLLVAVAAVHVRRAVRRSGQGADGRMWGQAVVLLWVAVPFVLALIESLAAQPIFTPRNLLMTLPAVSLALGWGFAETRLPRALAFGGIAVVIALRALQLVPSYASNPEDWSFATKYVLSHSHARDCIAFYPLDSRMPFSYYVRARHADALAPRPVFPTAPWSAVKPFVEEYNSLPVARLHRIAARCPRLWLVSSHEGQKRGPSGSRANFHRYRRLRAKLKRLYRHHHKLRFGYAATIHVLLLRDPVAPPQAGPRAAALSRRTSAS
jgi:mannosyltransferase